MHVHFLGVCGTFMAGLALIARELGHRVTGSDQNVYPPMSGVLARAGVDPITGYDPAQLDPAPDVVVVGNSMTRGNPCVEHILETGLPHASGPAWLSAHVLAGRHVVAVAGTHGKTTTTAMIAVILDAAGLDPGCRATSSSAACHATSTPRVARVGRGGPRRLFVIEADEYDTAFFDKRSKFLHYRPRTLVLNNLEFDHADIFRDLADMQRQFHHVVRIVPAGGRIVAGAGQRHIEEVLAMGCWTPVERVGDGGDWSAVVAAPDGGRFEVRHRGRTVAEVEWEQRGAHNVANALAAIAAARHAGVEPAAAARALGGFTGVRRRLEHLATVDGVALHDDFAHHPTAIEAAIGALRASRASEAGEGRLRVSHTSEAGEGPRASRTRPARDGCAPAARTRPARDGCSRCWSLRRTRCGAGRTARPSDRRSPGRMRRGCSPRRGASAPVAGTRIQSRAGTGLYASGTTSIPSCASAARRRAREIAILVMSNADFGGIQDRLAAALRARAAATTVSADVPPVPATSRRDGHPRRSAAARGAGGDAGVRAQHRAVPRGGRCRCASSSRATWTW